MNISVISSHRNNAAIAQRYVEQLARLQDYMPDDTVRMVAVIGDETDDTWTKLGLNADRQGLTYKLVRQDHGGPLWGSVEDPRRMAALSVVLNRAMGAADFSEEDTDMVLYVESDLLWSPVDILPLFSLVNTSEYDIVAPLIMAGQNFYDVWGFRDLKGERFGPFPPYHHDLHHDRLLEVSSVGSCFACAGHVARNTRVIDNNALVGWCATARAFGYRIAVWPESVVRHPA